MIDVTIRDYLLTQITNTVIVFEQPQERPNEFILLQKIDGGETNKLKASTFSIKAKATNQYTAAVMNESIKSAMFEINTLDDVSGVRQGGEDGRIDTSNQMYEYETIWNVYHY